MGRPLIPPIESTQNGWDGRWLSYMSRCASYRRRVSRLWRRCEQARPERRQPRGRHQLLHGDFNAGNVRDVNGVIRVFDLDDCGYGPPAFDVANALYMVLFDAVVHTTVESYETFRRSFVSGYVDLSRQDLADDALDRLIDLRVEALRRWLADLDTAPVGIRTASHDWLETLRSFAATHRPMPG
jgi:Ser/Thr protein kinase RdoA (MazF antagonist)